MKTKYVVLCSALMLAVVIACLVLTSLTLYKVMHDDDHRPVVTTTTATTTVGPATTGSGTSSGTGGTGSTGTSTGAGTSTTGQPVHTSTSTHVVFNTSGWQDAALMLLDTINETVDPCQDFYAYACGNYNEESDIGGFFTLLQDEIIDNITEALKAVDVEDPKADVVLRTSKLMMKLCVSTTDDQFADGRRILETVNSFGGWPVLNSSWSPAAVPAKFQNVTYMIGFLSARYNIHSLIPPDVQPLTADTGNTNQLYAKLPETITGCAMYDECWEETRESWTEAIMSVAAIWHIDADEAKVRIDVDEMIELERELAHRMTYLLPAKPEKVTLKDAADRWPTIGFDQLIDVWLIDLFNYQEIKKKVISQGFYVNYAEFANWLDQTFLPKYTSDDRALRVLYNYLLMHVYMEYLPFAGAQFRKHWDRHATIGRKYERRQPLGGVSVRSDSKFPLSNETCFTEFLRIAPFAAGRLYVDGSFEPMVRQTVGTMMQYVTSSFRERLEEITWLDKESRQNALRKLDNLVVNNAYPDWQQTDKVFDARYKFLTDTVLKLENPDLFDVLTAASKFLVANKFDSLRRPFVDRTDWIGATPVAVDAFYVPKLNSIIIPAGIINEPFFREDFPAALRFGGLGAVLGHEITHGYDNRGVDYDWDGTQRVWMSPQSHQEFDKMANCVANQYDQFCYPEWDVCVNGGRTTGENMADSGGLKAAYVAYKTFVRNAGLVEEPRLPFGLEHLSMDQVFFLAFAHNWCSRPTAEELMTQVNFDAHSPAKFRVIGSVRNNPYFGNVWNCKAGDPMMPAPGTCDVW